MPRTQDTDPPRWRAAVYTRLSRDDGDRPESDSIINQQKLLEQFLSARPDIEAAGFYADDVFTGTNFDRPDFCRMIRDIEEGRINCVLVKDLSRFGRDYIEAGRYLERWFPRHGVRFIAVTDGIDSERGYDMLLPVKNVFNEQYARDISKKVRSAIQSKQRGGKFIGAFAPYGYRKDLDDHNRLVIDPCAAAVVRRIFTLFEGGMGKQSIARQLNGEGLPCPSEYKRLNGERYRNGQKLDGTTYWTYATIHRMLRDPVYTGTMEQGRAPRQGMHGRARQLDRSQWAVVPGTHEAIIPPDQWERVQSLMARNVRIPRFQQDASLFAGFLRCGDCGRAMSKTARAGGVCYCCGSYKRYGPGVCTRHSITHRQLEAVILADLNRILTAADDLDGLVRQAAAQTSAPSSDALERCRAARQRICRLKQSSYEDYKDGIISRQDYLYYRADYDRQERQLTCQMEALQISGRAAAAQEQPWISALLREGRLSALDRATLAETVNQILVFEGGRIEITYTFSDDLGILGRED